MDRFVHSLVETSPRGRLPRAAVRRRPRGPAGRVRRPAALDRGGRVRRHRHLPRQPAGRLARRAGGRRSSPSAGPGTTPTPGTRGSTSTAPPAPSWPPPTCSTAATSGSPGSAGARTPGSARTGGPAGAGRCARAACPPPAWPPGSRTPSPAGARPARCCSTRRGRRRSSAPPTPWRWACCTRSPSAACAPGRDVAVVGFDDSQVAQVVPPGLTSVRQPLEQVAVEVVKALEGLLGHPPRRRPRRAARPHAGGAGHS